MNILDCIGHTPLVRLERVSHMLGANIFVKLEPRNPGGSIKDRAARAYIEGAMKRGELARGGCIVEATSGNLGIGLAVVCTKLDIRLILAMPASVSRERVVLLRALGAEVLLTPPEQGMKGAQDKADFLNNDIWGSFRPNQFDNPDGPAMHYAQTGVEILEEAAAQGFHVDAFVAGVGSGATVSGVGRRLKEADAATFVAAVEPAESPVLSGGSPSPHGIQGIGAGFVPKVFDRSVVDDILTVSTDEAVKAARRMLGMEGISCGISSGANLNGALQLARRPEFKGKNIVTVACDTGERYLSTPLFAGFADQA
ncbi:MAG TPA: cysteine synthase A [Candidatus Mailhella merdigallinarum]|uniref:cysteine synthase n=1 Tax=Candidatus Mailhella merdigallinarum TaxID=2838658 RepID=A0A9D2HCM1_9BACT|nr:cysteine synthase A [Desulfovibrionaceae bacterium]PWM69216.1 MAG: cysteine synthase A [Desulfovibrionaceae bacterium]HJA08668.1 cysteine synthase A [Candidatus Mailhella merdigallinarum]